MWTEGRAVGRRGGWGCLPPRRKEAGRGGEHKIKTKPVQPSHKSQTPPPPPHANLCRSRYNKCCPPPNSSVCPPQNPNIQNVQHTKNLNIKLTHKCNNFWKLINPTNIYNTLKKLNTALFMLQEGWAERRCQDRGSRWKQTERETRHSHPRACRINITNTDTAAELNFYKTTREGEWIIGTGFLISLSLPGSNDW